MLIIISKPFTVAIAICRPSVLYFCGIMLSSTYRFAILPASSLGARTAIPHHIAKNYMLMEERDVEGLSAIKARPKHGKPTGG
jgi:hypothetical protein